jgi:carboxyvinyl-carboxyphosphonate phosphorylmutase
MWTERRNRFRDLLASNDCYFPASVHDAMSARIAQDLGYETAILGGSSAALAVLGSPDIVVLTLTEFVDLTRRICRASSIPLIVDADHGYGNALNVMRAVEELEMAGVTAMTIEDTRLPAEFGRPDKPSLISIEEGVGKMKAALAARRDKSFTIVGRTSAASITDTSDMIARLKAYADAGVDAIFAASALKQSQLDALHQAVKLPMISSRPAAGEPTDRASLASRGVRICNTGHQPISAALRAVHETLATLRAQAPATDGVKTASAELTKTATRQADYDSWARDFLGGKSK